MDVEDAGIGEARQGLGDLGADGGVGHRVDPRRHVEHQDLATSDGTLAAIVGHSHSDCETALLRVGFRHPDARRVVEDAVAVESRMGEKPRRGLVASVRVLLRWD